MGSPLDRARRVAYPFVALVTLVLAYVMMRAELLLAWTGWTTDLGPHQVHDLTIFAMLWIALLAPMALAFYRARSRVNTVLAPLVFLVPLAAMGAVVGSPILMLPLVFGALALVALLVHPAGRDLLRFDRVDRVSRPLAGLLVVAAIPTILYAGDQLVRQFTAGDDHALFVHFGAMAVAGVYILVMGGLALLRERDWRFAAYSAGLVAIVVGASSVVFPVESSVGPLWGGLAVAFGVVFTAGVEYTRQRGSETPPTRRSTAAVEAD